MGGTDEIETNGNVRAINVSKILYSYVCDTLGESRAMLYVVYFQKPCVIRTWFKCIRFWSIGIENKRGTFSCFLSPSVSSRRKRKYYRPRSFKVARECPKLNSNSFPNRRARPFDAPPPSSRSSWLVFIALFACNNGGTRRRRSSHMC